MATSVQTECNFTWGECRQEGSELIGAHICKQASSNGQHSGLHGCAYCGVVYLARRTGTEFIPLQTGEIGFHPERGDQVDRWLKKWRDSFPQGVQGTSHGWHVVDDILNDYREHADTGTPLDAEIERDRT